MSKSRREYGEDITGQTFGRLTAIVLVPRNGHSRRWACLCECGDFKIVQHEKLTSKHTQSCGCLRRETTAQTNRDYVKTHGMSRTGYYAVWRSMLSRCENPKNIGFEHYGGRGIRVCDRWHKFDAFRSDMG